MRNELEIRDDDPEWLKSTVQPYAAPRRLHFPDADAKGNKQAGTTGHNYFPLYCSNRGARFTGSTAALAKALLARLTKQSCVIRAALGTSIHCRARA